MGRTVDLSMGNEGKYTSPMDAVGYDIPWAPNSIMIWFLQLKAYLKPLYDWVVFYPLFTTTKQGFGHRSIFQPEIDNPHKSVTWWRWKLTYFYLISWGKTMMNSWKLVSIYLLNGVKDVDSTSVKLVWVGGLDSWGFLMNPGLLLRGNARTTNQPLVD